MLLVRPSIESVSVYDIYPAAAERFKAWAEKEYGIPVNICKNAAEAVNDADIICTVTPSKKPFLEKNWVKKGAHINAVGTFSARTREVTSDLAKAARFYCDDRTALMKESGDFLIPIFEGKFREDHLVGSIGEVLLGKVPGRQSEEEITLFDGLGLAVEDVICCRYLICGR